MRIRNIRVIDPANGTDEVTDIYVRDGKIISPDSCGDPSSCDPEEEIIDGTGLIAGPGLVDVHVHFRDPGQTRRDGA